MTKITFNEIPVALEDIAAEISSIKSLLLKILSPEQTEPPPEVLNFKQAHQYLASMGYFIKESTLYKKTYKGGGGLPFQKLAGRLVFKVSELEQWVEEQSQSSKAIINNAAIIKSAIKKTN